MKRLLVLFLGVVSGVLIARYLRNRRLVRVPVAAAERSSSAEGPPANVVDTRSEDLRRRLEEARAAAGEDEQFVAPGMAAEEVAEDPPADEFEAMRRRVHAEAREAASKMRE